MKRTISTLTIALTLASGAVATAATFNGTGGNDFAYGTETADTMRGKNGNDILIALAGDDMVYGGHGDDELNGDGTTPEGVQAEPGNDQLFGRDGNDFLIGMKGADRMRGGRGDDQLNGNEDNDTLIGGDGNDILAGGDGSDGMYGKRGDDTINAANDVVNTSVGDVITCGQGYDTVTYGPGDVFINSSTGGYGNPASAGCEEATSQ